MFKSVLKINEEQIKDIKNDKMKTKINDHFIWLLSIAFTHAQKLSDQQKLDINMEMIRGERILNLYKFISNIEYLNKIEFKAKESSVIEAKDLVRTTEALLLSCEIYSLDRDEEIANDLELIKTKMNSIKITSKK